MKIQIRGRNVELTKVLRAHMERRSASRWVVSGSGRSRDPSVLGHELRSRRRRQTLPNRRGLEAKKRAGRADADMILATVGGRPAPTVDHQSLFATYDA